MLCYFTFPPFYSVFTLIIYCACVLHISAWDRNSVPLVFLHSLRHIYKLPFYYYMVTQWNVSLLSLWCNSSLPPHHIRIRSDHFQLHPSTSDYSRLPITRTFKGDRKKFELSGVRVIESSKKIAASKVKNSFYCTVNVLSHFIAEMLSENWKMLSDYKSQRIT